MSMACAELVSRVLNFAASSVSWQMQSSPGMEPTWGQSNRRAPAAQTDGRDRPLSFAKSKTEADCALPHGRARNAPEMDRAPGISVIVE